LPHDGFWTAACAGVTRRPWSVVLSRGRLGSIVAAKLHIGDSVLPP
jgi:hypothetical protein